MYMLQAACVLWYQTCAHMMSATFKRHSTLCRVQGVHALLWTFLLITSRACPPAFVVAAHCLLVDTGLVASTSLTQLVLEHISLPTGSGVHMFGRPGMRLPHLVELDLRGFADPDSAMFGGELFDPYLCAADLQSIVNCCAGGCLRKVVLLGVMQPSVNYHVLSPLTTLTSLGLGACTTAGVESLPQLQDLELFQVELLPNTLVRMAKDLTCLTRLSVSESLVHAPTDVLGRIVDFDLKAGDAQRAPQACDFSCRQRQAVPVCEQLTHALQDRGMWPDSDSDNAECDEDDESDDCC